MSRTGLWWLWWVRPLVLGVGTYFLAPLITPGQLLVYLLVAVPIVLWLDLRLHLRSVRSPRSPETSQITYFCGTGLLSFGAVILVLVMRLSQQLTESAGSGSSLEPSSIGVATWPSSPELLRGLLAVGGVLLATGWTLRVLFVRHEKSRRARVAREYEERRERLAERLEEQVRLLREIRLKPDDDDRDTGRSMHASAKAAKQEREPRMARRRERVSDYFHRLQRTRPLLMDDMRRLITDLRSTGLLSSRSDAPIALPEHEKLLANELAFAKADGSVKELDVFRLHAEEDELDKTATALRQPLAEDASRRSFAEHLDPRRLGSEFQRDTRERPRPDAWMKRSLAWTTRSWRRHKYFSIGVAVLLFAPVVLGSLAASRWLDARWLDTVFGVCAVVGAALLTLYAVLREASIERLEGAIEEAVEAAGRVTVLCSALERTLARPMALIAPHSYVNERDLSSDTRRDSDVPDAERKSRKALALLDAYSWSASAGEKLLEGLESRGKPTSDRSMHFVRLGGLPSSEPNSHALRRARVRRFEVTSETHAAMMAELEIVAWPHDKPSKSRDGIYEWAALWWPEYESERNVGDKTLWLSHINPPKALHLVTAEGALEGEQRLLALAFEPQDQLNWAPWNERPYIKPAVYFDPVEERWSPAVLEFSESELESPLLALLTGTRAENQTRLMDTIRREVDVLALRDAVRRIDESLRKASRYEDWDVLEGRLLLYKDDVLIARQDLQDAIDDPDDQLAMIDVRTLAGDEPLVIPEGRTLTITTSADSAYSGDISGGGRIVKRGSWQLTLSGDNTHSGGTVIAEAEGDLTAGSDSAFGGHEPVRLKDTVSDARCTIVADEPAARERLRDIRDALLRFQDRNLFPLERFVGMEGEITSKDDVLRLVLEGKV